MIFGFHGTGARFRGPQPGDEAARLLARLDQIQDFRRFVARQAPAEFVRIFRDFDEVLVGLLRSGGDWQSFPDLGQEFTAILEAVRGRFKNGTDIGGHALLSQVQIETAERFEKTIQRVIELWKAFIAEEAPRQAADGKARMI